MSILNMLTWWQWGLIGAVPIAIVLLYFLKLKRLPLEVPSTYLWTRTIEDLHVNSIWQRLRRNLLMFLQILLVVLLMLALLRPGWRGTELSGDRFVFVIDNSASMNATDARPHRLDIAKQQALELVDQMETGDVAMVIAFSDLAQVVQTFTESRRTLRRRIKRIQPTNRPTDLHEALQAAAGLANPNYTRLLDNQAVDDALPATLYILSDGGFAPVRDFALGNLHPVFLPIGSSGTSNLGIAAFSTDRNPEKPDRLQAFARVQNFSDEEATVDLELYLNGQSVDIVELTIAAGESGGWKFDLPDLDEADLKLVLTPPDALGADNTAYAAINRPRLARVLLITPGNEPLRVAMETPEARKVADVSVAEPSILEDPKYQTQAAAGEYDLIVYDRCAPKQLPQANTLLIGKIPSGEQWKAGKREGPPYIIDVDRIHPLTQLVEMNYVKIAEGFKLDPPPGSAILFDSVIGPIFAVAPRQGFEDAVLGFTLIDTVNGESIPNTTWPLRPSFPVFIFNVLRYLGGSVGSLSMAAVAPGKPITIRSPSHIDRIKVVAPGGERHQLRRQGQTAFIFTETHAIGIYQVHEGDQKKCAQRFVVNLFNERESNLEPQTALELGHETVKGEAQLHATRRELWKWIAMVGLLVLMFEWYIYNRRVYL